MDTLMENYVPSDGRKLLECLSYLYLAQLSLSLLSVYKKSFPHCIHGLVLYFFLSEAWLNWLSLSAYLLITLVIGSRIFSKSEIFRVFSLFITNFGRRAFIQRVNREVKLWWTSRRATPGCACQWALKMGAQSTRARSAAKTHQYIMTFRKNWQSPNTLVYYKKISTTKNISTGWTSAFSLFYSQDYNY